ncbi:hypothetical protein DFJ63DRAFT_314454 [Scheffersomyces coipomensis]|uniref:uncharacterized protein n=1 Tax=Scheffersomyces coipomensis TaxID=1788519 RepID=UPI00315D8646
MLSLRRMFRASTVRTTTATRSVLSQRYYASKFTTDFTPSPPRLPREEQEEFEKLQTIANSQIAIEDYNDQIKAKGYATSNDGESSILSKPIDQTPPKLSSDIGSFQTLKTIPEFDGEVNPKTGEVGGPKQDPLRHANEWAFNGRVTDF